MTKEFFFSFKGNKCKIISKLVHLLVHFYSPGFMHVKRHTNSKK